MDWVGNNLYWTDSRGLRIQVLDLDSMHKKELLKTGVGSNPTAIAVDPGTGLVMVITLNG